MKISINKIAKKLEIPSRTLRRRIEHLLEEGVIYEEVSLDTGKARGVLITSVIMRGDFNIWLPRILKLRFLSDKLMLYKNFTRFSLFIFYTESFSIIDELTSKMKDIDASAIVTYRNGSYNNPYICYPGIKK